MIHFSSGIASTNTTGSQPQNNNKGINIPVPISKEDIKKLANNQQNIGMATIGLGALAATGSLLPSKNKFMRIIKTALVLPAAFITTMIGSQMVSGAIKSAKINNDTPVAK